MMQYSNLRGRLGRLQLFPSPNDQQGSSWIKPVDYLAVTIVISGLGEEAAEQKVETLRRCTNSNTISCPAKYGVGFF